MENNIINQQRAEWLASCGFIFPGNEEELTNFELLHGQVDPSIKGNEIDPQRIINRNAKIIRVRRMYDPFRALHGGYKMVAKKKDENNGPSTDSQ